MGQIVGMDDTVFGALRESSDYFNMVTPARGQQNAASSNNKIKHFPTNTAQYIPVNETNILQSGPSSTYGWVLNLICTILT